MGGPGNASSSTTQGIRFAPVTVLDNSNKVSTHLHPRQIKDRNGCLPCKRRRVKCPDSNPICQRCQTRGEICERTPTTNQWRISLPRVPKSITQDKGVDIPGADWELLDFWFNRSCRILCNESTPSSNPFSFSLMKTMSESRATTHAVQSLSSAYRESFELELMRQSLEQRGRALQHLRQDISKTSVPSEVDLLNIVMLGLSSAWMTGDITEFGTEHLSAAHAVITTMLSQDNTDMLQNDLFLLSAGLYIYWDMACSFIAPQDKLPVRDPRLFTIAQLIDQSRPPSPVLGIATELFLLLGSVGRYCRHVIQSGSSKPVLEGDLERKLMDWKPPDSPELKGVIMVAESYRKAGLILLYRCQSHFEREQELAALVKSLFDILAQISIDSPYFGSQTLILTLVGSEIKDIDTRALVVRRLFELHRYNRLRVNYQALELLQEAWKLRDVGQNFSALQLMHQKGLLLMLG